VFNDYTGSWVNFLSRREYEYRPLAMKDAGDLQWDDSDNIMVLPNCKFEDDVVASIREPVTFEAFISGHPPLGRSAPSKPSGSRRPKVSAEARDRLLVEHPWLAPEDFLPEARRPAGKTAARVGLPPPGRCALVEDDSEEEPDEDATDEGKPKKPKKAATEDDAGAGEALREIRDRFAHGGEDLEDDVDMNFYVMVRGGAWALREKGTAADCVAAYARKGRPTDWCARYAYPKSASFAFGKYGEENAHKLAKEFCRRARFFIVFGRQARRRRILSMGWMTRRRTRRRLSTATGVLACPWTVRPTRGQRTSVKCRPGLGQCRA